MISAMRPLLAVLLFWCSAQWVISAEVTLSAPESTDTGHFTLTWEAAGEDEAGHAFVVQQAREADFSDAQILYEGPSTAATMSGLLDGVYYYRARLSESSTWSESIAVVVQHHSLTQAFIFLGLGAIVFLSTGVLIIGGHIKQRRESNAKEMA